MNRVHLNIDLSFQQIVDAVKQLSPEEKMKLSDVIWGEQMAIPQYHQDLVMERQEKIKENPNRLSDWDDAVKTKLIH